MESLRLGVLDQQQRAARTRFEGAPIAHWQTGTSQSLAPPPEKKPKAAPPAKSGATAPASEEEKAAILSLYAEGMLQQAIARKFNRSAALVSRVIHAAREAAKPAATPVVVSTPPRRFAGEGVRLHVLAWRDKMDKYEYSVAPDGVLPKKIGKHQKGYTHQQLKQFVRSTRAPTESMRTNPHIRLKTQVTLLAQAMSQLW